MADVSRFISALKPMFAAHLESYLSTNGEEGYLFDASANGGSKITTCLILKTIGRKSGRTLLVPLIYSAWGDEYIIVASKGGSDEHPAWFSNLTAQPDAYFQVRNKKFRASWRIAEGTERARTWDYVTQYFPPYAQYQASTEREIPVVILTPVEQIDEVWTAPS
ncbi:MAG: nitroreductase family deazaflavin-dependent oxidoreductase [Sphingomonadales bacterium]|nr:nitroreductase family deazaflavin-dependent oxidoreductase [Sphingomonadales bacterium]MBU3993122.1 nitroreductase family deazaflavin-dependent oxidoreductase [Alphaproteobacteria bacterium]